MCVQYESAHLVNVRKWKILQASNTNCLKWYTEQDYNIGETERKRE